MISLQGKTAIVTGAGQGVGHAIATCFAEQGANVMFADMHDHRLEAQMKVYDCKNGPARYFVGDLSQRLAMSNLLTATIDAFDRVDILVNAHRLVKSTDPLETDPDILEEMLSHNMTSVLRLSQMVAKRMIKQATGQRDLVQAGAILNLSAIAAIRPMPNMLAYSIACAASEQATRGLALALAPYRIRVNSVNFSSVMTHELKLALKDDGDLRDRIVAGTPLGRIAAADELAETALYLVSEASRFMTGQTVTVDGGRGLIDAVTQNVS